MVDIRKFLREYGKSPEELSDEAYTDWLLTGAESELLKLRRGPLGFTLPEKDALHVIDEVRRKSTIAQLTTFSPKREGGDFPIGGTIGVTEALFTKKGARREIRDTIAEDAGLGIAGRLDGHILEKVLKSVTPTELKEPLGRGLGFTSIIDAADSFGSKAKILLTEGLSSQLRSDRYAPVQTNLREERLCYKLGGYPLIELATHQVPDLLGDHTVILGNFDAAVDARPTTLGFIRQQPAESAGFRDYKVTLLFDITVHPEHLRVLKYNGNTSHTGGEA